MKWSLRSLTICKIIVSIVWLLIVVSVIVPSQLAFPSELQGLGIFLLVAHSIELLVYKKLMRGPGDYLGTMLFGFLQLKSIKI